MRIGPKSMRQQIGEAEGALPLDGGASEAVAEGSVGDEVRTKRDGGAEEQIDGVGTRGGGTLEQGLREVGELDDAGEGLPGGSGKERVRECQGLGELRPPDRAAVLFVDDQVGVVVGAAGEIAAEKEQGGLGVGSGIQAGRAAGADPTKIADVDGGEDADRLVYNGLAAEEQVAGIVAGRGAGWGGADAAVREGLRDELHHEPGGEGKFGGLEESALGGEAGG